METALVESEQGSIFLRETISLVKDIETRFIELAARIHRIKNSGIWKYKYESYEDFLLETKLSPGTASKLASVYETYIVQGGLDVKQLAGVPYSSLYTAIPLIGEHGVESTVAKVKTLTRSELADEVREDEHGVCLHEHTMVVCVDCHKRVG